MKSIFMTALMTFSLMMAACATTSQPQAGGCAGCKTEKGCPECSKDGCKMSEKQMKGHSAKADLDPELELELDQM